MEPSFIFNKPVTGRRFAGRKSDVTILSNFLRAGENIVIYEPPKAGKDSLIQQALLDGTLAQQKFDIVNLSLLNVRTMEEFCFRLGTEILKLYGTTYEDFAALVAEHLAGTHFVFDPLVHSATGNILSLGWDLDDSDLRAVVSLPYRLARARGRKLIVCLDEFQSVMLTDRGDGICAAMREAFKARTSEDREAANYILYGSQVNAMKEIFEHRKLFWRQVERIRLSSIDDNQIVEAINRGFLGTGKVMEKDLMRGVCRLFQGNMFYINYFCSLCDSLSKGYITEPVLTEALSVMLAVHEPRFRAIMSDLTTFQVSLLKAVVEGHTKFSGAEVINRYQLNSSANVRRLKDALCKKEILIFDSDDEVPRFEDPLFEYWVTKFYFEKEAK